eukprot:7382860-Prymnesium_polylepis.1
MATKKYITWWMVPSPIGGGGSRATAMERSRALWPQLFRAAPSPSSPSSSRNCESPRRASRT